MYDAAAGINVSVDRRHVGMVFQSYAIWPHMTVFQNVAFPLEIARVPKAEVAERVAAMLELVGLGEFGQRGASKLSGGQMQRVALARSLVNEPSVLLLDEPLSNLDARLRDRLRVQLREIQTQLKITAVYVTHDQHEALSLADTIVVLRAGAVLQSGEPIAMYRAPKSSTVAAFLGYSNVFDASVVKRGEPVSEARLDACGVADRRVARRRRDLERRRRVRAPQRRAHRRRRHGGRIGRQRVRGGDHPRQLRRFAHPLPSPYRRRLGVGCRQRRRAGRLRLGDRVSVRVAPEHVLLLPKDDTETERDDA